MEHPDEHAGAYAAEVARLEAQTDPETVAAFEDLDAERAAGLTTTTTDLLDAVAAILRRFMVWSSDHDVHFVALWVLHTYVFGLFDASPYLHVTSPSKRAGKSRLLELLNLLVAPPWSVFDASEAVLFRKVNTVRPTLLIDEIDATFGKDSKVTEGLRAIYNVGYKRGATVARCVGNGHEWADFEVYCPKAFAGLAGLPDTVEDRCGKVTLRRRARDEPKPERFRFSAARSELAPLGERLAAWAEEAESSGLADARPELPEELSDRAEEVCEVLAAVAGLAGGEWAERARAAFLIVMGEEDDADYGVVLLEHCREAFDAAAADELATVRLLALLVSRGDASPWAGWWGKDFDDRKLKKPAMRLAQMLKPYGIGPKKIRFGKATRNGYFRADFADAWVRYGPLSLHTDEKVGTSEHASSEGESAQPESDADQGCSDVPTFSGRWRGKGRSAPNEEDTWDTSGLPTPLDSGGRVVDDEVTERLRARNKTKQAEWLEWTAYWDRTGHPLFVKPPDGWRDDQEPMF